MLYPSNSLVGSVLAQQSVTVFGALPTKGELDCRTNATAKLNRAFAVPEAVILLVDNKEVNHEVRSMAEALYVWRNQLRIKDVIAVSRATLEAHRGNIQIASFRQAA